MKAVLMSERIKMSDTPAASVMRWSRLLRSGGTRTRGIPITDDPMAYDNGKRLLLYALVKGLGDAVRRNVQSAAKR